MEQTIFKVGDRVFHIQYGWGIIDEEFSDMLMVVFDGRPKRNERFGFTKFNNKLLSFTEYTLNGFSQERPEPLPNKGDVVWVRDREYDNWMITYFMKLGGGEMKYGTNPRKSDDSVHCYYYKYLTTIDPYKDGKQG